MLGSPVSQHIWSPSFEKVPGSPSAPWVRLSELQFRVPAYHPRVQCGIVVNLWANCHSGFVLMQFVLSCKTWNVNPEAWLPGPPRGSLQSQDSSPILSMVRSQQGGRAFTVQGPGRLEARWEACSALSLKPKGDYLFNFPHSCAAFTIVKFWNILSIPTETLFPLLVLSPGPGNHQSTFSLCVFAYSR